MRHAYPAMHQRKRISEKSLNVTFENLGKDMNRNSRFFPFVTSDDQTLVFIQKKRPTAPETEFDGLYPSDVLSVPRKAINGVAVSIVRISTPT